MTTGILLKLCLLSRQLFSHGTCAQPEPQRVIVRFADGVVSAAAADAGSLEPLVPSLNMHTVKVEPGSTAAELAARLSKMKGAREPQAMHQA